MGICGTADGDTEGKKATGHTFALARNETSLLIYDNESQDKYLNDTPFPYENGCPNEIVYGNYRKIIFTLSKSTLLSLASKTEPIYAELLINSESIISTLVFPYKWMAPPAPFSA